MNSRWIITLYCLPAIVFTGAILPFVLGDLDFEISRNLYNEKAQLWTHSQTFPSISYRPHAFAVRSATGWGLARQTCSSKDSV